VRKLAIWVGVNLVLLVIVLTTTVVPFGHFWQKWEFLAAFTAALYNGCFSIVGFYYVEQPGGKNLSSTLKRPFNGVFYVVMRMTAPSLLFLCAAFVIWSDRHVDNVAVEWPNVFCKLLLTFLAFTAVWLGDTVTARHLRNKRPHDDNDLLWAKHLRRHAWIIDLPLVVGYAGLMAGYIFHRVAQEDELFLQAFVGGASALEMLVLSAVHSVAELADHETIGIFTIPSRRSIRA
jgi:hypothetical protein